MSSLQLNKKLRNGKQYDYRKNAAGSARHGFAYRWAKLHQVYKAQKIVFYVGEPSALSGAKAFGSEYRNGGCPMRESISAPRNSA